MSDFLSRIFPPDDEQPPDPEQILKSLVDEGMNLIFSMVYQAGLIRLQLVTITFLVLWTIIALTSHPIYDWQKALFAVVDPSSAPDINNPPLHVLDLFLSTFFAWDVLGHLIALALPFYLAQQFAAIFLDDIYELKDSSIALKFITRAAFAYPIYGVMQIENGDVRQQDKKSTIFNIGGPGRVRVSLENVAVFEKVNGEPELIGSTAGNRWFARNLEGFERLRQVIDVRDQTISISDLTSRTKDGIPVTVQNIRMVFSVVRDTPYTTLSRPYPYSQDAILRLVYGQSKGPWTNSITSLVRSELISFINEHTFGEIFAAVGEPEVNRQIQKQSIVQHHIHQQRNRSRRYRMLEQIRTQAARIPKPVERHFARQYPRDLHPGNLHRPDEGQPPEDLHPRQMRPPRRPARTATPAFIPARIHYPHRPANWIAWVPLKYRDGRHKFPRKIRYPLIFRTEGLTVTPIPRFVPRPQLSRRFYEDFARSFPERAHNRGVRLEWIDVGTWHPPSGIILEQHLDAWAIVAANMVRGDRLVLDDVRRNGQANELIRLIRRPIYRFLELQQQNLPREEMVYLMVEEYMGLLRNARDESLREGIPLPERLLPTINLIQRYQRTFIRQRRAARYL